MKMPAIMIADEVPSKASSPRQELPNMRLEWVAKWTKAVEMMTPVPNCLSNVKAMLCGVTYLAMRMGLKTPVGHQESVWEASLVRESAASIPMALVARMTKIKPMRRGML